MLGKARTKDEEKRFAAMHERGCVPCWLEAKLQGRKWVPEPADIHHCDQGSTVGHHMNTYSNCPWHHRGVCKNDLPEFKMREIFGPSMAKEPCRYHSRYGSEVDLLGFQSALLLKSADGKGERKNDKT